MSYTLGKIASFLGAEFKGDADCKIIGICSLTNAKNEHISFLNDSCYIKDLGATIASAVIIKPEHLAHANNLKNLIIVNNPYLAYAKISALFDDAPTLLPAIHSSAKIDESCETGKDVSIGPNCVIGRRVKIGDNTKITAGCVIDDDVIIGENCKLYPNVVLYHRVRIGDRVFIHSGVVIGSDGFGNANENGVWHKIYQLGTVMIGNDVEIGANTTIDRGAIEDTVIEDNVKLDNQIQIGHNVYIGAHTAIAGCVGIAGSTKIGKYCMIGGGVGINGHIEITDGVIITGKSAIAKSITTPGMYSSGIPAMPHKLWGRVLVRLRQLEDIIQRLKAVEKKQT